MTTTGLSAKEKRVLNPRPYRHYRRTYSVPEVRAGAGVLLLLAVLTVWIAWKGAHPDPSLFGNPASAPEGAASAKPARAAVGPVLPPGLAAPGWRAGNPSSFDSSNLYEKIDGRAEYFLTRGFRSLAFVTLSREGSAATTVDVELYDLGAPENALSALSGEKADGTKVEEAGGTSWYLARNALFLVRGRTYVRAIGSDEGAEVKAALAHLEKALEEGLAVSERAFSYALFSSALGVPTDKISYVPENAFSFGFARNVHSALLSDGETEVFVVAEKDPASAAATAARFQEGFLGYGDAVKDGGETWVKDRYLGAFGRTFAEGSMVVGVRGAPTIATARQALEKLRKAVAALPADVVARAASGPGPPAAEAHR